MTQASQASQSSILNNPTTTQIVSGGDGSAADKSAGSDSEALAVVPIAAVLKKIAENEAWKDGSAARTLSITDEEKAIFDAVAADETAVYFSI